MMAKTIWVLASVYFLISFVLSLIGANTSGSVQVYTVLVGITFNIVGWIHYVIGWIEWFKWRKIES